MITFSPNASIRESNDCHNPGDGQFCGIGLRSGSGISGRTMVPDASAWYSFRGGDTWTATKVKSVPVSRLNAKALDFNPGHGVFGRIEQATYLASVLKVPDKPGHLTVYRIGSKTGGLENRNAANLVGLATFINQAGLKNLKGRYINAYHVTGDLGTHQRSYSSFEGKP
jgi:hypothetical protein